MLGVRADGARGGCARCEAKVCARPRGGRGDVTLPFRGLPSPLARSLSAICEGRRRCSLRCKSTPPRIAVSPHAEARSILPTADGRGGGGRISNEEKQEMKRERQRRGVCAHGHARQENTRGLRVCYHHHQRRVRRLSHCGALQARGPSSLVACLLTLPFPPHAALTF